MKFKRILTALTIGVLSFSLSGCLSNREEKNETELQIREVYKLYRNNGGTMTYEEWLDSIKGEKGDQGDPGQDGDTPFIGSNGNWWIGNVDTGVPARGETGDPGQDGNTPFIGSNGNWWIGNVDTGVPAKGETGDPGQDGTSLLNGHGAPSSTLGKNGDSYFDLDTWDYYIKVEGEWVKQGNISTGNHVHQFSNEVVPATCTTDGCVKLTCDCGYVEYSTIPATGHNFGSWIEIRPATCDSEGLKKRTCTKCGEFETTPIEIHDHNVSHSYMYNSESHWKYCSYCGVKSNIEPHNFVNGFCSICNFKMPQSGGTETNGFLFGLSDDGTYYKLIDCISLSDTDVVIPDTYNGKPVKEIGNAFANNKIITSVVIPDSVTTLSSNCFSGCTNLKNAVLPDSITQIPDGCFLGTSLESIVIPDSVIEIGRQAFAYSGSLAPVVFSSNLTTIMPGAFSGSLIESIVIPDSVTFLGSSSFSYCYSLTSVVLPNDLKNIQSSTFESCSCLEEIHLPSNLETIGSYAFIGCGISSITIPLSVYCIEGYAFDGLSDVYFENVDNWYADDTKVFAEQIENSKNAAKLLTITYYSCSWKRSTFVFQLNENGTYSISLNDSIHFPDASITIPSSYKDLPVTEIAGNAFSCCQAMTEIFIPEGITKIGDSAFYGCTSLTSIIIPLSVETITGSIFGGGCSLTVYCRASSKPSGWYNKWNGGNTVVWGYEG